MLTADPDQLQQVLVNLLLNACDASAAGRAHPPGSAGAAERADGPHRGSSISGSGIAARAPARGLRSVLHDQAARRGDRAGAADRRQHRAQPRRARSISPARRDGDDARRAVARRQAAARGAGMPARRRPSCACWSSTTSSTWRRPSPTIWSAAGFDDRGRGQRRRGAGALRARARRRRGHRPAHEAGRRAGRR